MAENGRPTWRDLVNSIEALRGEMQGGFRHISARLTALEIKQASAAASRSTWKWIVPLLISGGAIAVAALRG